MSDPSPEPLSGPDNAWRRMGDRTNLMQITGVVMFDEPIDYADLIEKFEARLLPFRRFRQRIVGRDFGRRPRWHVDPHFDIDSHVHHVALPEPQDTETFRALVGDLMSRPIDPTKPLWQAHLVDGAGEGNALVIRIHHSVGDGFALLYVLLGLADDPDQIELPIGTMPEPPDHVTEEPGGAPDTDDAGADGRGASPSADGGGLSLSERVSRATNLARTAYRSLTLDAEPETALVGDLGVQKRVAWTSRVSVDRLKAVGHEHDATINDLLLATTAGALRRHLRDTGEAVDGLTLRAAVPVNLRPMDERDEDLGNYFGLGFLELPVGEPDVAERLEHVKANTGELKQGTEAFLLYTLLRIFGRGPPTAQKLMMGVFRNTASAVVTNVPGPTDRFEFCGEEVSDIVFWVPQSNGVGLGISILSYDGSVRVGVAADAGLLPEPFDLAGAFEAELEDVLGEAVAADD